jgi:hypothetical protein
MQASLDKLQRCGELLSGQKSATDPAVALVALGKAICEFTAAFRDSIDRPKKKPRKPSDEARFAYALRVKLGLDQHEIAAQMQLLFGRTTPIRQSQVSKWIQQVERYAAICGIPPEIHILAPRMIRMSNRDIDKGPRLDGRVPRGTKPNDDGWKS